MADSPFVDCCRVYVRQGSAFYALKPACFGPISELWQAGKTFYTGVTLDDEEVVIKLAEVEAVMNCTVASQESDEARRRAIAKYQERDSFA